MAKKAASHHLSENDLRKQISQLELNVSLRDLAALMN